MKGRRKTRQGLVITRKWLEEFSRKGRPKEGLIISLRMYRSTIMLEFSVVRNLRLTAKILKREVCLPSRPALRPSRPASSD